MAIPLKHIKNPNASYCFHCCHAVPPSFVKCISSGASCMDFLPTLATIVFLFRSSHSCSTVSIVSFALPPTPISLFPHSKRSHSYSGLFSLLLPVSHIAHSFTDSLYAHSLPCSLSMPADFFYLRVFAFALPCIVSSQTPSFDSGVTMFEVPALTALLKIAVAPPPVQVIPLTSSPFPPIALIF